MNIHSCFCRWQTCLFHLSFKFSLHKPLMIIDNQSNMALISGYECVTRRDRSFSLRLSWEWTLPSDLRLYRMAWSYSSVSCLFLWWRRSWFLSIPFSRALPATPPMGGTLFLPWTPLRAVFLICEILDYLIFTLSTAYIIVVWGMFACMLLWFGQGHLLEGLFFNEAIPLTPLETSN